MSDINVMVKDYGRCQWYSAELCQILMLLYRTIGDINVVVEKHDRYHCYNREPRLIPRL